MFTHKIKTETKGMTLEQLDEVFSIPTKTHIYHNISNLCGKSKPLVSAPDIALGEDDRERA